MPKEVQTVLATYCVDCHGAKGRGNVQLTNLESLKPNERLDTLNKVQDQLFFKMMPPAARDQPGTKKWPVLRHVVRGELRQHKASKLDDRLPYPDAGNYVDHAALFDGTNRDKPFTPARRWLVSPQIFDERVLDVFKLEGREREQLRRTGFHGVTNPFVLPDHAVRYYDLQALDGGHLLVMLTNAKWIASKQLRRADEGRRPESGTRRPQRQVVPEDDAGRVRGDHRQKSCPDGRRDPCGRANTVRLRPAAAGERSAGVCAVHPRRHQAGRQHGGAGADAQGGGGDGVRVPAGVRRGRGGRVRPHPAVPSEAAYAIAYALGDHGPNPQLLAARESQLAAKASFYEREVLRLLADKKYYAGPVDKSLGLRSTTATHPPAGCFFREFLDTPPRVRCSRTRSVRTAITMSHRGGTRTPGHLVDEADALVDWAISQDGPVRDAAHHRTSLFTTTWTTRRAKR